MQSRTMNTRHLGIDFGGVVIPMVERNGRDDTQFSERFLGTDPRPAAFEEIGKLVTLFSGDVWIVSKAGARTESLTREWLAAHDFFGRTGMPREHLRFCRERIEKLPICLELGLTHFIDDRIHIMQVLRPAVSHLFLFGDKEKNQATQAWTTLVSTWPETYEAIADSLEVEK